MGPGSWSTLLPRLNHFTLIFASCLVLICLSAVVAHGVTDRFTCDPQTIPHALSLLNTGRVYSLSLALSVSSSSLFFYHILFGLL